MGFVIGTNPYPPKFQQNADDTITTELRHDLLTVKGDGKPVDDDELVNIILNNVSSAQACDTLIFYDDLVALFLNAKIRLKAQQIPSFEANPTTMYAPKA
ncbi:hypothetical protein SADUNF_Sadunf10G0063600 [Salix dunnii]|uniref:Uncharacterized protein n=1 Tax=Salix dunnii TaxID=1413687 RepID=A0A835MRG7_9ROSI|nr:hypothetical protein SADUNF_Sadunf10G0063600 [Salix dunnii]